MTASSTNGNVIGYFTQVVWKETTKVGFGKVTRQNGETIEEMVVARYSPPGNLVMIDSGQSYDQAKLNDYTRNVQPLKPGAPSAFDQLNKS